MSTRERQKVFCVGRNKTGTTSLGRALENLGFQLGKQSKAELLLEDWGRRDFAPIVRYCRGADAFQDIPFSLSDTYEALDSAFPDSRFILTMRDSADEWFESLVKFHTAIVGKGRLPTAEDLREFPYRYKGWLWRNHQLIYGVDEATLYDREIYTKHYLAHNQQVVSYFESRPQDLLVLNLNDPLAMGKLSDFLAVDGSGQTMPHLNQSTPDVS